MRRAIFLDRDGTLIELVHHLVDPTDVKPIEGAGLAARHAGCRGVLVRTGLDGHVDGCRDAYDFTVADITAPSELILQLHGSGCPGPDGVGTRERSGSP